MTKILNQLVVAFIAISTISNAQTIFEENGGSLTIPAESLTLVGSWQVQTLVTGFNGTGYIVWTGADSFNTQTALGTITTQIKINTPGRYLFKWRNKVGQGTTSTDFNDSWLKFPNATNFYGQKTDGSRVYPNGSGKTPIPAGASSNGYFKVYLNVTTAWTDRAFTSDNNAHSIYVEFASAGEYTMLISARSRLHLIDEIYFIRQGDILSVNDNIKQTNKALLLSPNPVEQGGVMSVTTNGTNQSIQIFDVLGKKVLSKQTEGNTTTLVHLNGLEAGSYILKAGQESAKFIVK